MRRVLSFVLVILMVMGMIISGGLITAETTSPYKDVKTSRWSYADIMYVTDKGLMNGTSADKFAPAETMTRAMVVTVLYRLQGEPAVQYKTTFTDVKEGKWYTNAILWAAENEIVNGVGNSKYAPMETVTREQLATIIMRYAPMEYIITEESNDITHYADYKRVHDYAREALSWANAVGLITGKTETTLAPREGATREQFAAILKRFREYDSYKYELVYNAPVYSTVLNRDFGLVENANIYVSVDGSDTNPGTLDKPIATFARAKEMVRELKKTAQNGITVAFKAGEYGGLDNLTFTAEDAGTAECPITYTAYGDGEVIFSNGLIFNNEDFKPLDESEKSMFDEKFVGDIYKIDLDGKLDEITTKNVLFGGVGVCVEARYPNRNADGTDNKYTDCTTRVEEEGKEEHEYDKLKLSGPVVKIANKFSTYEGLKITGMFRTGWLIDTFNVKSYDRDSNILTLDFGDGQCENGYPIWGHNSYPLAFEDRMDDTIFFHNLAELLDADGEYWFDTKTKTLYVYNPQGDYALSKEGSFITLEEGADHITFRGFEFNASVDSAIHIKSDYFTLDGCTIANIAGLKAVNADYSINHLTVKNCELYNFVCGGVIIRADADLKQLIPAYNVVTNNYFHDFGLPQYFADNTAVSISRDVNTVISHNVFKNGAHAAIVYNDSIETFMEYNVFDNMMMTTMDYGAVYSWNNIGERSNHIRYNLFMNIKAKGGAYSIYVDGSCGQLVYGNIFYNGGDKAVTLNGGRDNDIHDNIYVNTKTQGEFLMYNEGVHTLITDGITDEMGPDHWFFQYLMRYAPQEGEAGYDKWLAKWPIIYSYNIDPAKVGEYECVYTIVNYIKNNAICGSTLDCGEMYEKFGVKENNKFFELTENPYFADPTHGDYTIVDGAGVISDEYTFDFSKVGLQ